MSEQFTHPIGEHPRPPMLPQAALGISLPETERHDEAPDFRRHVANLEQMAAAGIETPRGKESYIFRAGIEIEFALYDPKKVKAYLEGEGIGERKRIAVLERMKNPDQLDGHVIDDEAILAPYRAQALKVVEELPATNEAEEARRQEWLGQIDSFTVRDLINFRLYSEFSHPTLGDVTPPNGTLQELDAFSERQGWLEFRFGQGTLQTGYYDNEGMSEIRLAPVAPSEALHRRKIVMARATELATEYGMLLESDHDSEHVNVSLYAVDDQGDMRSVIGLDESHSDFTVDITSGIAAAYEDGLFLHAKEVPQDFTFGPHSHQVMEFGPTRKSVRILNGYLELRAKFYDAEQGTNALMAGIVYGLEQGDEALRAAGHATTEVVDTFKVNRTDKFVKNHDLQIQRALENSEPAADGSFKLNPGWNWIRGEELTTQLIGEVEDLYGSDSFNELVMAAVRLDSEGKPYVNERTLSGAEAAFTDIRRGAVQKFIPAGDMETLASRLNERLAVVRLEKTSVIKGGARYATLSREDGINKVMSSPIADLAYQGRQGVVVDWLREGQAVYDYLRVT